MGHYLRFSVLTIGAISVVLALGFAFQLTWATRLWAWPDSRLSYIFLGAMFAATAASTLWVGYSGELGAIMGGALAMATIGIGMGTYLMRLFLIRHESVLLASAIILYLVAAGSLAVCVDARSIPIRDRRRTPLPVRIAFIIFAAALLMTAFALMRHAAHVFPWPLRNDTSVMIGCIFLGNAVYFIYGLSSPFWGESAGQLMAFLAYDLVLIVPFLRHFSVVQPAHRMSLSVYVGVLVSSGLLAVYYLFLSPRTRLWGTSPEPAGQADPEAV